jgi:hypothetical protein
MHTSLFGIAARIVQEQAREATRGALSDHLRPPLDEWAIWQQDRLATAALRAEVELSRGPRCRLDRPSGVCP